VCIVGFSTIESHLTLMGGLLIDKTTLDGDYEKDGPTSH
jgi:hypothetical protein